MQHVPCSTLQVQHQSLAAIISTPPVQFACQSHCHALRESEALGALALVVPHKGMLKRHNLNKAPAYILSAAAACHLFNFHACAYKPYCKSNHVFVCSSYL